MASKLKAKTPELVRLRSKLKPTANGCLEWSGWRQPSGHGQAFFRGRLMPAHRAVYMATFSLHLKKDQLVCHKCDNPPCCNVEHLYVGDAFTNMQDAVDRKRHVSFTHPERFPRGEQSYRAKVTEADVTRIKTMLASGMSCRAVAEHFPITRSGISKIKHSNCWKHLCQN